MRSVPHRQSHGGRKIPRSRFSTGSRPRSDRPDRFGGKVGKHPICRTESRRWFSGRMGWDLHFLCAVAATEAAPLLCAGVTTFNALRKAGLEAGALVAVQGVGGLGHLGIQFARNMGFKTVAIGLGPETAALALELGAHVYIDSLTE